MLQIFSLACLLFLVPTITTNLVSYTPTTINWDDYESAILFESFATKILGTYFVLIILLFSIRIIILLVRIFQDKDTIWKWRYSTRISFLLLIFIFGVPMTINGAKLDHIRDLQYNLLDSFNQKYINYLNTNYKDYIFEKSWEGNFETTMAKAKSVITQDTDSFEEFFKNRPPTNGRFGIYEIYQLYEPEQKNYICDKDAIYRTDTTNDKHSLIFLIEDGLKLIINEKWSGGLSQGVMYGPKETYYTATDYDSDGSTTKMSEARTAKVVLTSNILKLNESAKYIKTGCWNRFECPDAKIGKYQKINLSCRDQTSKEGLYEEINSYRGSGI